MCVPELSSLGLAISTFTHQANSTTLKSILSELNLIISKYKINLYLILDNSLGKCERLCVSFYVHGLLVFCFVFNLEYIHGYCVLNKGIIH